MQQVILNLITNAIDAMKSVAERDRVLRIVSEANRSDEVHVVVEDTGIGFQPEDAAKLFNPFFTTKTHGMGMGLSICRSIIESYGGRLWATPGEPHGAAFQFTLPAAGSDGE